jgi:hypothetical protein
VVTTIAEVAAVVREGARGGVGSGSAVARHRARSQAGTADRMLRLLHSSPFRPGAAAGRGRGQAAREQGCAAYKTIWVRVLGGTLTESTVFPTDESMYDALTRVVQPPRCWQHEAGASQQYAR